jgi:hypothetical protein
MSEHVQSGDYLGYPLEAFPLPCRSCDTLARFALKFSHIDLTKQTHYPMPPNEAVEVARFVLPKLGNCTENECGLSGTTRQKITE